MGTRMRLNIPRLIMCLLAVALPTFAETPATPNPMPTQGLENRIEFWKKVYTLYGADDIIIHDRTNVNVIYDVATNASLNEKIRSVGSALKELRAGMDAPESLSPLARQIYATINANGLQASASFLDQLSDGIHTQRGIKERFRDGVVRSGRYLETFREIFRNAGLPEQLALLPMVESSFVNARSSAGAVGFWQFTRGTGKLYMTVSNKVDERQDPIKATIAASRLLGDNYRALGAWPLAITAYNHGRAGMQHAKDAHGSDLPTIIEKYDGPLFGYASSNFYSEFIAAVEVYESYPQYFGQLTLDTPIGPAPQAPKKAPVVQTASAKAPAKAAPAASKYKVQNGDTLWVIAQRFGTTIRDLMDQNNLKNPAIYAGQMLLVK
jgi:membrane-bound lytic murein transglycosylase D